MATDELPNVLLLVEADVIVRFALADYLRACGVTVIEATNAHDARQVLVAGPPIQFLMCDAQLGGEENGFALVQWVRGHRPGIEIIMTSSVANKAHAASEFCARYPDQTPASDSTSLATRIHGMMAERKRRLRPPATTATTARRRKR